VTGTEPNAAARASRPDWIAHALRDGLTLLAAGRCTEAAECCRKVLAARPDLVGGHFLVGLIALELRQTWTAISAFGSVTRLDPGHGAAWAQLARLYMSAGQPNRADAALEKAIRHPDPNGLVQDLIGSVHSMLGDQVAAAGCFDQAVERQPRNVAFLLNKANNQMFLGRLDAAAATVQAALALQPDNPHAHWILANLRRARDRSHVEVLERLIAREPRNPKGLAFLGYALGKELEDLQDWDAAFTAFETGARARRQLVEFDEPAEREMFDALERICTPEWLGAAEPGHEDPSPIFVIGQPRTGTTLVERIITSHSQVHSAGELRQFGNCIRRLTDYRDKRRFSGRLVEEAAKLDGRRLGQAYITTTRTMRGTLPRFVDKLPTNYLYLPFILKALPRARIVHLCRNPMDAAFACYKQLFADAYPHSYDQREMARHHARYRRLMQAWRERFPGRFLGIAYEDIASDFSTQARRLIDYLELPWEDSCLDFHRQDAAVTTASAVQVREPVHTRSIGRWRRFEARLEPMRRAFEEAGIAVRGTG
jgi:tetratricopeptide (TPR) repeat protein